MTLAEITAAVDAGKTVHWRTKSYTVRRGQSSGDTDPARYFICHAGGHCISLTWSDGVTLNGKEIDFCLAD